MKDDKLLWFVVGVIATTLILTFVASFLFVMLG